MMHVEVECADKSPQGTEPRSITLGARTVEVIDIIDRWQDQDKNYFRVQGEDSCTYMLCFDLNEQFWELTSFERREEIQEQMDSAFRHSFRGKV